LRVVVFRERAIGVTPEEITALGVPEVLPRARTFTKGRGLVGFAQRVGEDARAKSSSAYSSVFDPEAPPDSTGT